MCRIHFRHAPVAPVLRTVLLERLYTVKGLAAAREFYDGAAYSPPFGRGFHLKMLELEKSEGKIDAKRARRVYEAATDQFKVGEVWFFYKSIRSSSVTRIDLQSQDDLNVWVDFAAFEGNHGRPRNVEAVKTRARAALGKNLSAAFDLECAT